MNEATPTAPISDEPKAPTTVGELAPREFYDVSEQVTSTMFAVERMSGELRALVRATAVALCAGLLWYTYVERRRVF